MGSCGPVARQLEGASEVYVAPEDLGELSPISVVRGSAIYRLEVVAAEVERVLRGLLRWKCLGGEHRLVWG